ncbi:MAG: glycogen synthase GlgA [Burkholderiales bacterium]|nr:glycogen synthase GlgA [Burkholderiales bacterium]
MASPVVTPTGMRVLFATSEAAPLVKTGGLADVSSALPAALARLGSDVRVLLPGYGPVLAWIEGRGTPLATLSLPPFPDARLVEARGPDGRMLWVLDCPPLFARDGGLYQRRGGDDWPDNDVRFGLLSRAAAVLSRADSPVAWRPEVLHCNDWQTGLAPAWLALEPLPPGGRAGTVMTIHNLAYQGVFAPDSLPRLGLPWDWFRPDGVEFWGQLSFLKAGLQFADALSTVSPTYAQEIRQEPLGFGLQGLLAWRARDLVGILNGIDVDVWDPASDPLIPQRYDARTLAQKAENRAALRTRLGLDVDASVPLAGVVSRFAHQKGLDLLIGCAERALALPMQLAVLGSGDPILETAFQDLAARHPGRVGLLTGFDESLSHLIEAGADLFVMPSRYEPCGLNQMYSQRYGTPVVARRTGGLADSIVDATPEHLADGTATGVLFDAATPDALLAALARAAALFADRPAWRRMQQAGMARDFSWDAAARAVAALHARVARTG